MRKIILLPLLLLLIPTNSIAQPITQADLLKRVIDLDRLIVPPPVGERAGLFSSYDRRQSTVRDGRYVNWDANNDRGNFLHQTADGWNVMAYIQSPGALTRIWCEKPAGLVRLELDGQIVIDGQLADLFNGATEPFGMPLSYEIQPDKTGVSYYPIGFEKSCRLLCREYDGEYQIDYVTYPAGTKVETFNASLNANVQSTLDAVAKTMRRGFTDKQLYGAYRASPYGAQQDLKVGEKLTWDLRGAGIIRGFHVSLTDRREPRQRHALHNMILRITWDGAETPAIEVPLTAFFGTGFERNLYRGLTIGTNLGTKMPGEFANEGWFMYSYYPMPFTNGAHIEIENLASEKNQTIGVMLYMRVDKTPPPPNALRFKVRMRTEDPCKTFDFPIVETTGAGRLVGCTLNIDCPREQWWGEGDHKIQIDDENFPSILGTSTAAFFGNVTGLRSIRMPLHGATRVAPVGKNSVYRWLLSDSIPFNISLKFTLENWQYDQADDVYYNTVAYWYGQPGAATAFESLTPDMLELAGLRIPGAVEIEGNITGENWGRIKNDKYAGNFEFSGQAGAIITTRDAVQIGIPHQETGKYRLSLRVQTGRSFGTVAVSDSAGNQIGIVSYDRESDGTYRVGDITVGSDKTTVSVQCSRTTILDCWVLEKVN